MAVGDPGLLDLVEEAQVSVARSTNDDQHFARVAARPPHPVVVVTAGRLRQIVLAAEVIDGARLAVVVDEERRPLAVLIRQGVIDAGQVGDQLVPAEHVGIVLRQIAQLLALVGRGADADEPGVVDVVVDIEDRQGERQERPPADD